MSIASLSMNDVDKVLDPDTLRALKIEPNSGAHQLMQAMLYRAWHFGYDRGSMAVAMDWNAAVAQGAAKVGVK